MAIQFAPGGVILPTHYGPVVMGIALTGCAIATTLAATSLRTPRTMSTCIFCDRSHLDLLVENDLAFAIRDKFPVRQLHALVLPKRHVSDTFELTADELKAVFELGRKVRDLVMSEDPTVGGYNFGSNNGPVAGQKIPHVHFHLIPRREGEEALPAAQASSGR